MDTGDNWYWYEKNNGKVIESSRSDSIGSYSAFKELQEASSVELLRSSILRSITKKKQFENGKKQECKNVCRTDFSNLSYSNVELKFLQNSTSLNSNLNHGKTDVKPNQQKLPLVFHRESDQRNISNPIIDLENSDLCEENYNLEDSLDASLPINSNAKKDSLPAVSNKNSLNLVFRRSNSSIFEDCSTYDIHYDEISLPSENNSLKAKYFSKDICGASVTSSEEYQFNNTDSQNSLSDSTQCDSTDDQTTLCDTIFSTVINGDSSPSLGNSLPKWNHVHQNPERKETSLSQGEEVPEEHVDEMNTNRRIRRSIRKKNRKCKSKEPHVYECPKCKVSYIISTPTSNNAAYCLHCDLWTSVDPVFFKREKQQWNTCLIC